jgi:hypothetical protein
MRMPLAPLLAFAAAACGGGGAPMANQAANQVANQAPSANTAASAQASGARVAALPEGERNGTFYRAIHDAGMDCQNVTASRPAGTYHGLPVWNADCRGGGHWTLVIGNNDIVQVLNANEARLVTDRAPPANGESGR